MKTNAVWMVLVFVLALAVPAIGQEGQPATRDEVEWMANRLCEAMVAAVRAPHAGAKVQAVLPFLVCTSVNV